MTAPSLIDPPSTNDALKASVVQYTNARVALATAILGAVGASLVWLVYLAVTAHNWTLLGAFAVGAVGGFVGHWLQHYVRVAIRERSGETVARAPHRPLYALLWAAGLGLIALSAEHVLIEMVGQYLHPFLASLVSLVPAGAIIGWSMSRGRSKDENLILFLANGLSIGLVIAVVTGIIWTVAFGDAEWGGLLSWWGLIGLGTHVVTPYERNAVRMGDPIAAVVIVFVATFLINLLPNTESSYNKLGPFATMAKLIRSEAAGIQASPGLPGPFSADQARRIAAAEHAKADSVRAARQARSPNGSTMPSALPSAANLKNAVDSFAAPPTPVGALTVWESDKKPEFIFSWLIILCFALGAGLAPSVERTLRPIDYPNSETFKRDLRLTGFMVALLAAACVVGRWRWFK